MLRPSFRLPYRYSYLERSNINDSLYRNKENIGSHTAHLPLLDQNASFRARGERRGISRTYQAQDATGKFPKEYAFVSLYELGAPFFARSIREGWNAIKLALQQL
jgi:hypothetical protein